MVDTLRYEIFKAVLSSEDMVEKIDDIIEYTETLRYNLIEKNLKL